MSRETPIDNETIPKRGGQPLYQQIKEKLVHRLAEEHWRPGQLLPSEIRLAEEFGVSQGTMRRALEELSRQGLLVRHQGRGTSVPTHDAYRALFHFFQLVDHNDSRQLPESDAIALTVGPAQSDESTKLRLRKGQRVIHIVRLRYLASQPKIFERIVLSHRLFEGLEKLALADVPNTIYEYYERRFKVSVVNATERIRAVAATTEEGYYLRVDAGSPLLEIERVAFTHRDRPIELRISRCLTDEHVYINLLE